MYKRRSKKKIHQGSGFQPIQFFHSSTTYTGDFRMGSALKIGKHSYFMPSSEEGRPHPRLPK